MKKGFVVLMCVFVCIIFGCANKDAQTSEPSPIDTYMISVAEQATSIRDYLENEAMTQYDMNMASKELYELWDEALNYLWSELKTTLSEDDYKELQSEQLTWITEKETAVNEAGKDYEGGSMYSLIIYSEAASITEERVYLLYDILRGYTND